MIIKSKILPKSFPQIISIVRHMQVYMLVFDTAPQPFDEHIVNTVLINWRANPKRKRLGMGILNLIGRFYGKQKIAGIPLGRRNDIL